MNKNGIKAMALQNINAATITPNVYTFFCTIPFPLVILRIINQSTAQMFFSYDGGVTTNELVSTAVNNNEITLNFQSNHLPNNNVAVLAAGTNVYVTCAVGATGFVYLTGYYLPQG